MAVLSDAQREAGWTEHRLSDVIELIGGGTPKTTVEEYWNGSIPWLSVVDFSGDSRYVSHASKSITQLGLENSSTKLLNPGDLILSARGTVGELAQLTAPMAFNQSCFGIRSNFDGLSQNYLYYLLLTVIGELRQNSHGSIFSTVNRKTFESVDIVLPPLEEQERIAGILGSLDDKIEANTRLIQTMDSYKSTLFQAHICSESEGETIKVSDVATLIRENIAASDIDESMNYVALEHIPRHSLYSHEWTNSEGVMSNKSGFKVGDILFGKLRPYFHKVSIAAVDGIASTDILVLRPKPGFEVLAQSVLSSEDLIEYATQVSSGTRMPRASWKDIMNYEVTVKNVEILQESLSGFDAYSRALIHENKVLTETRDALIKRLID